jgi:hypothetical protein
VFDDLTQLISLLVVLSVAAERLVEILKNFIFTKLATVNPDPVKEARRQGKNHLLAIFASLLTAIIVKGSGQFTDWNWWTVLAFGFLASGGSGLWNSVLGWAKGLKDIRQSEGKEARLQMESTLRKAAA